MNPAKVLEISKETEVKHEEARPVPQQCHGELQEGRFLARPWLAELHPETGAPRYRIAVELDTQGKGYTGNLVVFMAEWEMKDLPRRSPKELAESGHEPLSERDVRDLAELGTECKNLIDNYLKVGRSDETWAFEHRDSWEQVREQQQERTQEPEPEPER